MNKIKVFVSSTQKDLPRERKSAERVVRLLSCECLRAETLSAPSKSPKEACREMAQSCHIYLGIFGGRYGFIDPELNISVTEMEYNEARKDDPKKILIYIKRKQKYDSKQKKFLKRIQDFNKGYFRHEYFSTTKDLNKQIRKDLVNWIAGRINGYSQMKKDLDSMKSKDKAITTHYQQLAKVHNLSKDILL